MYMSKQVYRGSVYQNILVITIESHTGIDIDICVGNIVIHSQAIIILSSYGTTLIIIVSQGPSILLSEIDHLLWVDYCIPHANNVPETNLRGFLWLSQWYFDLQILGKLALIYT